MKRMFVGVVVLLIWSACGNRKATVDPSTQKADFIGLVRSDSLGSDKAEEPKPTKADESFNDFIYNFASDDSLQRCRVRFPLSYYNGHEKSNIEESYWKHDDLFTKQSFYTLLFDKDEDMDLVSDTTLTSVRVEWIFVKTHQIKRYYFERIRGAWMLEAINLHQTAQADEEDFIDFYSRFATDSIFQSQHVQDPLVFVTTDPDDDFAITETTLSLNQWFAFRPVLPADRLSNIDYGQRNDADSTTKILALKGIGDGFSNVLYFRKKMGQWVLCKFEDISI